MTGLREFDFSFEGISIHGWSGGSGFPIVLVHGSGAGAFTMSNYLNHSRSVSG